MWANRLHTWMTRSGITLRCKEEFTVRLHRVSDASLVNKEDSDEVRDRAARLSWATDKYMLSQMVNFDGDWLPEVSVGGSDQALIAREDHEGSPLLQLWNDRMGGDHDYDRRFLGKYTRARYELGAVVVWWGQRGMEAGSIVRLSGGSDWNDTAHVRKFVVSAGVTELGARGELAEEEWEQEDPSRMPRHWDEPDRGQEQTYAEAWRTAGDIRTGTSPEPDFVEDTTSNPQIDYEVISMEVIGLFAVAVTDTTTYSSKAGKRKTWMIWERPMVITDALQHHSDYHSYEAPVSKGDEGRHYEGRLELLGWEKKTEEEQRNYGYMWHSFLKRQKKKREVGGEQLPLESTSDGSREDKPIRGSFAWQIAGTAKDGFLVKGRAMAHGYPEDLTSTRAERLGYLAVLTAIEVMAEWAEEVHPGTIDHTWQWKHEHRMDNRGAAAVEPGGMAGADLDLQDQLDVVGARASPKHEVVWIRGHPERRSKPQSQWDRHEQAIFDVDAEATEAYKDSENPGWAHRDDWWEFGSGSGWQVWIQGRRVKGAVTKQIKSRCAGLRLIEHLARRKTNKTLEAMRERLREGRKLELGTGERVLQEELAKEAEWLPPELRRNIWPVKGSRRKVFGIKFIGNVLYTLAGGYRSKDLDADEIKCRLCGKADETQEHVMWNCCGSASIKEARERMSAQIKAVLVTHGLSVEAVAAALMPWRLEEKGDMKGAACWSGLDAVILDDSIHSGETSTRAALVSELAKGNRLHLARCGILGKPYVDAIAECGVLRETVEAMVAKIRKEVDAGASEVWNSFNSSVHHKHDAVGEDMLLTERATLLDLAGRVKFADAKRRGTHLNLPTICESFEVEFGGRSRAQQTSWLRTVIKWSKGGPECDGLRKRHGSRSHNRTNGIRIAEMEYNTRKGKKLFDPAKLRTKGGRQTLIYDIMPQLRPKTLEVRKRSRNEPGTTSDQSAKSLRKDRERGQARRRIREGNDRDIARGVEGKRKKNKKRREKRRESTKFFRPVREDRRGSDEERKKKKQEIMKKNEKEMAEDRREEEWESTKRRKAAAEAVKAASRGRKKWFRLQQQNADDERVTKKRRTTKAGLNADVDGERWDDGEVSFSLRPEEAAEAHDAEGLRERSHSGEKDASEARSRKENG